MYIYRPAVYQTNNDKTKKNNIAFQLILFKIKTHGFIKRIDYHLSS